MKATTKISVIGVAAVLILVSVALLKPLYGAVSSESQQSWVTVFASPSQPESSQKPDQTEAFGRQLDLITAFYSTVISLLLGAIAAIAALAFWTVRLVSRSTAEDIARDAAKAVLADSREFNQTLQEQIGRLIDERLEEMRGTLEAVGEKLKEFDEAIAQIEDVVGALLDKQPNSESVADAKVDLPEE